MLAMLFTVTVFISLIILLRCICKNRISARLQYAIWLLVAVKLLIFPMPNVEGNFSVLRLVPGLQETDQTEEIAEGDTEAFASETEISMGEATIGGNHGSQLGENSTALGTNAEAGIENVGAPEGSTGRTRNVFTGDMTVERLKMRVQHYVRGTLGIPLWMAAVLLTGSLFMVGYMLVYHIRLGNYLRKNGVPLKNGAGDGDAGFGLTKLTLPVYGVKGLPTPCLFGRSIYIPERLIEGDEMLPYILEHEMCHSRHGDSFWGILRMLCVCLYWYHPFVWLAAYLSRQDCELACDEAAVRHMEQPDRKLYGELLLELALVKASPADCFSMTTAMSGNARNLKQRLERITGKRKNRIWLGVLAVTLAAGGIAGCITSGMVEPENQRQSIRIEENDGNYALNGSYAISYQFSRDAMSYGIYMEEYEYGVLQSAELLTYGALTDGQSDGRKTKRGEGIFGKTMEADEVTGEYTKFSYSLPDMADGNGDGPTSVFSAFVVELPDGCVGNSFSMSTQENRQTFRLNEDVILLADYYGDKTGLQVPSGHIFLAQDYYERTAEILKFDRCVILLHLVVSDMSEEELLKSMEEKLDTLMEKAKDAEEGQSSIGEGGIEEGQSSSGEGGVETGKGYTDEELTELARNYYKQENGFAPYYVEIDHEDGDMVTLWLYDRDEFINAEGEITGSANTRDWYTVDRMTGKGEDVNFQEIDLSQAHRLSERWTDAPDHGESIEAAGREVIDARDRMNSMEFPVTPEPGTENNIYFLGETEHYTLYGLGDYQSMLLYDGTEYTQIFQPFVVDAITEVPQIQEADYDGDGEMELAIKKVWGRGTGIWEEKLWIADPEEDGIKVYEYYDGAYAGEMLRHLSWGKEGNGVRILVDGGLASPLLGNGSGGAYDEMGIDTGNVSFSFSEGKIDVQAKIACGRMESSVMPAYYMGYLNAEVIYQGNGIFHIGEIKAGNLAAEETAADAVRRQYEPAVVEIVGYQYNMSKMNGEELEMTVVVRPEGMDSYEYVSMPLTQDGVDSWIAGEIALEK